tara:strand:+ start:88 stop:702 length:615 start_codon:yes stop_codon:yes gene_type:complete
VINSNKTRRYEEALRVETPDKQSRENECDFPNCRLDGLYKAPKGPKQLRDYYFFCLQHVREYNRSWNFNEGLNEEELEQMIRRSTTWDRPSWPFGARKASFSSPLNNEIRDVFGLFRDDDIKYKKSYESRGSHSVYTKLDSQQLNALSVMELELPIELEKLKSKYKDLVKLNHPDRNGGDKESEERLKIINEAYTTLQQYLKNL